MAQDNSSQPHKDDAALGGQTAPIGSVILGGFRGVRKRFRSEIVEERVAALQKPYTMENQA